MEVEVLSTEGGSMRFRVVGEGYTMGNLIQEMLLQDKRVKGAGFIVPHPLKKEIIVNVFLAEGNPHEVVKENAERFKAHLEALRSAIDDELERVKEESKD